MEKVIANMIFGTIAGVLAGLVPLIVGVKKRQTTLGVSGFFASVLCGAVLGLILAVPISGTFTWLAVRASRKDSDAD